MIGATYLIETPLDPAHVADVLAGEQSSGTFVRVARRDRRAARAQRAPSSKHSTSSSRCPRRACPARCSSGGTPRARGGARASSCRFRWPTSGATCPTLAATVAGNLYDLGEATGVRLEHLRIAAAFRARFERPRHGVAGTRRLTGVDAGPLVGTIIKPNVGLTAAETGALVGELCDAGIDFIKDDECCGNPEHAPTPTASAR